MASTIYRMANYPGMATVFGKCFLVIGRQAVSKQVSCLSTSCSSMIKWRFEQNVEPNPNRFGHLTNLPDYSFVDGRPAPLAKSVKQRLELQESYCKKIIQLSYEMDFAVERHRKMDEETKEKTRELIKSKLKNKGELNERQGKKKKFIN